MIRLRDRDAIVTREGIIFRVYGNTHPPKAYVCDPEYARAVIYRSTDPRAYRARGKQVYYKFYADEGLQFIRQNYPQHVVWAEPMANTFVGVREENIWRIRQPHKALQHLLRKKPKDSLLHALHSLLNLIQERSSLSQSDFGVFGSLLHNFHHPDFSDLDLIIYGADQLQLLTRTLGALFKDTDSLLQNEFAKYESVERKHWKFVNYSLKEYLWHQERKRIYCLFQHTPNNRKIKAEFEPVKRWEEIENECNGAVKIVNKGWIKLLARVTDDSDSAFIPSVYLIEPIEVLKGTTADDPRRVVSYVEEFRLQAKKDELVVVEGNLEQVSTPKKSFHQVVLTYCDRYYEQTLKVAQQSLRKNHKI